MAKEILTDDGQLEEALSLLDKRGNISSKDFNKKVSKTSIDPGVFAQFDAEIDVTHEDISALQSELDDWGIGKWCLFDFSIVRGLIGSS